MNLEDLFDLRDSFCDYTVVSCRMQTNKNNGADFCPNVAMDSISAPVTITVNDTGCGMYSDRYCGYFRMVCSGNVDDGSASGKNSVAYGNWDWVRYVN